MRIVKVSFARPRVQGTRSSVTLESTKASLTLNSSVVSLQEASTETFVTTQGDQDTDLTSDEQQPFLSFRRQNLTASAPWAVDVGLPFARLHIDQSVVDDLSQFAERATQEIPIYTKVDLSLRVTDCTSSSLHWVLFVQSKVWHLSSRRQSGGAKLRQPRFVASCHFGPNGRRWRYRAVQHSPSRSIVDTRLIVLFSGPLMSKRAFLLYLSASPDEPCLAS